MTSTTIVKTFMDWVLQVVAERRPEETHIVALWYLF